MARELKWSEEASDDLAEIHAYIARDSVVYAGNMINRIVETAESLDEMAERGRIVPEYQNPSVREVIIGNYRLVYRIKAHEIGIVGVIHGARLMPIR